VIAIRQHPAFNNSAGIVATYTGIFDIIRDLFAKTDDAVAGNFGKGHFSFLNREGRCEQCEGTGKIRISMDFISDVNITCDKCKGRRFNDEILTCHLKGKNISEILCLTLTEAACFFHDQHLLRRKFEIMEKVGLGYLQLGQSLETLSGGESQRLVLAAELMKPAKGNILYLFEEPSTGLHFQDIKYLMKLFHELADLGHTLLVIEHDPDIIIHADWIIELGPGGGDIGGDLVVQGMIREIFDNPKSVTGIYLSK
jgi:excinuclease ABC subunit A